jgi:hypothetical protein
LLTDDNPDGAGEAGTSGRLAAVVQVRLWSMMQRKLYDPSSARKISRKSPEWINSEVDRTGEDESPNLLGAPEEDDEAGFVDLLGDDFEDLLAGDESNSELLDCLDDSERERLVIEQETEEMLFGSGWDRDEEDYLLLENENDITNEAEEEILLDGGSESDSMLV